MRLRFETASLRETKPRDYFTRFLYGGIVTVLASLIGSHFGAIIGGLFLAFPATLPSGVSLVEKHKIEREVQQGKQGTRSARGEAAVEATGASAGALGLGCFGLVLWRMLPHHTFLPTMLCAMLAWLSISWLAWWARERL